VPRVAEVGVLASSFGEALGELGVEERPEKGDPSAGRPREEAQRRRRDLACDDRGIHEDPSADHPAHDDHGGVERAEPAREGDGTLAHRECGESTIPAR